MNMSNLV